MISYISHCRWGSYEFTAYPNRTIEQLLVLLDRVASYRKVGIPRRRHRHRHRHPREDPRRHVRHVRFPEVIPMASKTTRR